MELADDALAADWEDAECGLFGFGAEASAVAMIDPAHGSARLAFRGDCRFVSALFAAPEPVGVSRSYLMYQIGGHADGAPMSGCPEDVRPDRGATVCA